MNNKIWSGMTQCHGADVKRKKKFFLRLSKFGKLINFLAFLCLHAARHHYSLAPSLSFELIKPSRFPLRVCFWWEQTRRRENWEKIGRNHRPPTSSAWHDDSMKSKANVVVMYMMLFIAAGNSDWKSEDGNCGGIFHSSSWIYLHIEKGRKTPRLPFCAYSLLCVYDTWENNKRVKMLKGCKFSNNKVWYAGTRAWRLREKCLGFLRNSFNTLSVYCCTFLWCFPAESQLRLPVNIVCCDEMKIRK